MAHEPLGTSKGDKTVKIGGLDTKTGKPNPTQVEGYYMGRRLFTPNDGGTPSYIYQFKTENGTVDVWGKADINAQMENADEVVGCCVRIRFREIKKLEGGKTKYMYDITADRLDKLVDANEYDDGATETELDEDVPAVDNAKFTRTSSTGAKGKEGLSSNAQARTKAFLGGQKSAG